jgi:ParB/RepB/Spo0J family partition protein
MGTARNLKLTPDPEPRIVTLEEIQPVDVKRDNHFDYLMTSIQELGILQAPIMREPMSKTGKYEIIAGRRRVAAARELGMDKIIAVVYPKTVDKAFIPTATIAENRVRSNNIGADIIAMGLLIKQGYDDPEVISNMTGLPISEAKELLSLRDLPAPVLDGIVEGNIATTTAKEVKKLRPQAMAKAITVLEETGKLTANDIRRVREVQIDQAASQVVLPDIPELPQLDDEVQVTNFDILAETQGQLELLRLFKDSVVEILDRDATDSQKVQAMRSLVELADFVPPAPTTIAQRVKNRKVA